MGFLPQPNGLGTKGILEAAEAGKMDIVWLLGADELDMQRLGKSFRRLSGPSWRQGRALADVILPGAAYTEKSAITSIPKAARKWHCRLSFRPAMRGKTGQSSALLGNNPQAAAFR